MKNFELVDRIYFLENKLEYQEKMFEVREQKIRLEERENRRDLQVALNKAMVEKDQFQKRMDEHPYKLVSDMLKALVVKFPTLNINDLAINSGTK